MISLGLRCPACQKKMSVPDHAMGRRVQCPACEHVFRYTGQRDLTLGRILHGIAAGAMPRPAPMLSEDLNLGDTIPMSDLELDIAPVADEPVTLPKTEQTIELTGDDEMADLLNDEPASLDVDDAISVEDSPVDIIEEVDEIEEVEEVEEIADAADVMHVEEIDELAEVDEIAEVEPESPHAAQAVVEPALDDAMEDLLADEVVVDEVAEVEEVEEVEPRSRRSPKRKKSSTSTRLKSRRTKSSPTN